MAPQPFRPSWIQRRLLLLSIHVLKRFRPREGTVLMLTDDLCVKYGYGIDLVEAQSMVYVGAKTKVPVPRVHMAFVHKKCTYILMERIHGQHIGREWFYRDPASKARLLTKLKGIVLEMRALKADSSSVRSVSGGSLYDPRMPCSTRRFGPFQSISAFHEYLRNGFEADAAPYDDVRKLIRLHGEDWGGPTFTHGDLSSFNILADGDDIAGIVDWETAGWYPSYWEYTTARQVAPQNSFWEAEIDNFLEPMPRALTMEKLRQRYFGDF